MFMSTRSLSRRAALLLAPVALLACVAKPTIAEQKGNKNPRLEMVIQNRGTIIIELYKNDAPKTVEHFISLVNKHFYDGTLFHRVIAGFVAQGGDPKTKGVDGATIANLDPNNSGYGEGGSGTTVPLEVKAQHDRGTLGLARAQDPNSGDSQFFFNLVPNHSLDSGYCCFGKVVKGMDVMDAIRQGDKITSLKVIGAEGGKKKK
jgi:cyclophilin family peptidyl-prolyl cis-trans isomerase